MTSAVGVSPTLHFLLDVYESRIHMTERTKLKVESRECEKVGLDGTGIYQILSILYHDALARNKN